MSKYLTKSRFKLALGCPTKLFYTGKKQYENLQDEDSFLMALAEGGFQVGELAKCYYPGGHDITERGYDVPLERTNELLKQENVVIYEAAVLYKSFFIRVDVLEKIGNQINLIEVKAKSFKGTDEADFLNKKGFIDSGWDPYLQDVAFQKYVMQKAFPDYNINAFLMLANKNAKATVNGLNQHFQLVTDHNGQTSAQRVGDTSLQALGDPVLTAINVDIITSRIINDDAYKEKPETSFEDNINYWSDMYDKDEKIVSQIGLHCFSCEYNTSKDSIKLSGFRECWSKFYKWTEDEYKAPKTTDVWNFSGKKKLFEDGIIFIKDLMPEHIGDMKPKKEGTISNQERQWLQIDKLQKNDNTAYFDKEGMADLISGFTYPLHFIDFETSMVAIPFYKGQRPYEQVAFQFSHHIMDEKGNVEHVGEFFGAEQGKSPNVNFVRELKKQLEKDEGTIFRYAAHENTVLKQLFRQLDDLDVSDVPDKNDLMEFILRITEDKKEGRYGERNMVDMLMMVKSYYYDPYAGGSNSIKAILPAVLKRSKFIQERYSKTIYGKDCLVKSLNFEDGWVWIKTGITGEVISPYKLLPPIFEDIDQELADNFTTENNISDGGAAMTAFAKIQFTQMSDIERNSIIKGLLRYCELDTLAMVMIYEYWVNEIKNN